MDDVPKHAPKRAPIYKFDSAAFVQEGSIVVLFDPRKRYFYNLRVMQFVVDDIVDILRQAEEEHVIPVSSAAYIVFIYPWDHNDYGCDMHVTEDVYNKVKATLEAFHYRPSDVEDRLHPVLTDCMPDLEHCLSNLSLRASCLSAKFKRARDMPHFVRERETTGRSKVSGEFDKLYWLKKAKNTLLADWGQISTVGKFYRICRTFLNGPSACLKYRDRDPVSGEAVTYILQCGSIVRQFSNLDWNSRRMLLPNVIVDLKQNIDAVKTNVLDRDDHFVSVNNVTRCIVNEMRDILEAMLVLNVIYGVYWSNLRVVEACAPIVCLSMRSAVRNVVPSHMDCFYRFAAGHAEYEQRMRNRRDVDRVVRELCAIPRWRAVSRWARDTFDAQSNG
jgi:hypothetical protein